MRCLGLFQHELWCSEFQQELWCGVWDCFNMSYGEVSFSRSNGAVHMFSSYLGYFGGERFIHSYAIVRILF